MSLERIIRKLDLKEGKEVYYQMLINDFAPCEVKPWKKIEKLVREGLYEIYGMWEGKTLLAYGFLSKMRNDNYLLMDYFAVNETLRGRGYGQYFLTHIKEKYPGIAGIVFEVEDVKKAENLEDMEIRTKRIQFYEKAGLKLYPLYAKIYDADYQIMFFSGNEEFPSVKEMIEIYMGIYDVILGQEKMEKYLELTMDNGTKK